MDEYEMKPCPCGCGGKIMDLDKPKKRDIPKKDYHPYGLIGIHNRDWFKFFVGTASIQGEWVIVAGAEIYPCSMLQLHCMASNPYPHAWMKESGFEVHPAVMYPRECLSVFYPLELANHWREFVRAKHAELHPTA